MNKIKRVFQQPNMEAGYLYFYIHFITEIICFWSLSRIVGDSIILWVSPLIYDAFAFIPQSIIGYFSDNHPKINIGLIGIILLTLGLITQNYNLLPGNYSELIILCLGNAFIHVAGAETTLRTSFGKLSHSAIFVSGGSFGVITGKILSKRNISVWIFVILSFTMIPFLLLSECYREETWNQKNPCDKFSYHNSKIKPSMIIFLAIFIVIVRGYMGYGIPTSWNKTVLQNILLYSSMGLGKALGGILTDAFGIKKIANISILLSLPFLLFGDQIMWVSLIGILLFSMTMSITLAILVSVIKRSPGLAFGLTTIGLFLGTLPIFFFQITTVFANIFIIIILNILCFLIMQKITKGNAYEIYKNNSK